MAADAPPTPRSPCCSSPPRSSSMPGGAAVGSGSGEAAGALSLAVLPIENVGGDSAKQYLADGMTTELAGALRKMPGLQVAGDLSTFRFRRATGSVADMARQLGVRMLLTGKLQSQGGRVRLQMQLADAGGKLLWSNTFDRENKDNFALQDEVTAAVASDLRLVLSPATIAASRAGRTVNPEAHDLYMRGMFEKNQLSEQGLRRALSVLRGRAEARLQLRAGPRRDGVHRTTCWRMPTPRPTSITCWRRRRRIGRSQSDSMLAAARVIRGFEMGAANWEFERGLAEMRRGIAQDPNDPDALFMFSGFLAVSGHVTRGDRGRRTTGADRSALADGVVRA